MPIIDDFEPADAGLPGKDGQPQGSTIMQDFEPASPGLPQQDHDSGGWSALKGLRNRATDTIVDLAKGMASFGDKGAGLVEASQVPGNDINVTTQGLKEARTAADEQLSKMYSDARQQSNRDVADAKGFGDTAKALVKNPSVALGGVVQGAPQLAAAITMPGTIPIQAGVNGGLAGYTTGKEILDNGGTAGQALAGGAISGAANAAISASPLGRFSRAIAGNESAAFAGNFISRAVKSGVTQGGEAAAGAAATQGGINVATGKPLTEGVGAAAAQGGVSGVVLGSALGGFHKQAGDAAADATDTTGDTPSVERTAEDVRAQFDSAVPQPPARGRVYTPDAFKAGAGNQAVPTNLPDNVTPLNANGATNVSGVVAPDFAANARNNPSNAANDAVAANSPTYDDNVIAFKKDLPSVEPSNVVNAADRFRPPAPQPDNVTPLFRQPAQPGLRVVSDQPVVANDTARAIAPEPLHDMQAQIDAIADPSSSKDTMIITPNSPMPKIPEGLIKVSTDQGTVVTSNPEKAQAIQQAGGRLTTEQVGELLGYTSAKQPTDTHAVQALDRNGNVVHEEATRPDALAGAMQRAHEMAPEGGGVRMVPVDQVLKERAAAIKGQDVTQQRMLDAHAQNLEHVVGAPQPIPGTFGKFTWNGKEFDSMDAVQKQMASLAKKEAVKTSTTRNIQNMISDAFTEAMGRRPTMNEIEKLTKQGLQALPSDEAAKANLAHKIGQIEKSAAAGKGEILEQNLDYQVFKSVYAKLTGASHGESTGSTESGVTEGQRAQGTVPENGSPQGTGSAAGTRNAEAGSTQGGASNGQAAQVAELQGQQPEHVRAGSAEAAQGQQGVERPRVTEGNVNGTVVSVKKRRGVNAERLQGQEQTPAGDVSGRPAGVGPVSVRPAGELRQPAGEQAGAARDSSVRSEGAADRSATGDAAERSGGDAAGRAVADVQPEVTAGQNDVREEALKQMHDRLKAVMSERDFNMIMDYLGGTKSQEQVAGEHGLTKTSLTKKLNPAALAKLQETLERSGFSRADAMELFARVAPEAEGEASSLHGIGTTDQNEMLRSGQVAQIKSVGGSQSEWKGERDLTAQWIKAREAGDTAAMKAIEAKLARAGADEFTDEEQPGGEEAPEGEEDVNTSYDDESNGDGRWETRSKSLERIEFQYHGAAALGDELRAMGIQHAEDAVDNWHTADLPEGVNGMFSTDPSTGKTTIAVSREIMESGDDAYIKQTMAHEFAHAIDDLDHGGVYSVQPELRFQRGTNGWQPVGEVAQEINALWRNGESFGSILDYPLDITAHRGLASDAFHGEVFAQLWSVYNMGEAWRAEIERVAPATAEFLKAVHDDIKSEPTFQDRAGTFAEDRREGFADRNSGPDQAAPARDTGPTGAESRSPRLGPLDERLRTTDRAIGALPERLQPVAESFKTNFASAAKKAVQWATFGHDLADWAKATLGMEKPRAYMDLLAQQEGLKHQMAARVQALGKQVASLKSNEQRDMQALMMKATVGQMKLADVEQLGEFKKLSTDAQQAFRDLAAHGDVQRAQIAEMNKNLRDMYGSDAPQMPMPQVQGVYFPLRRFGKYVVMAKSAAYRAAEAAGDETRLAAMKQDPAHYYFGQEASLGAARAKAKDLGTTFGAKGVDAMAQSDYMRRSGGVDAQDIARIQALVERTLPQETDAQKVYAKAVAEDLSDMYMKAVSENGARSMLMKRNNVVGVKPDEMLQGFFTNAQRHDSMVARNTYGQRVQKAMSEMQEEVHTGDTVENRGRRQDIANEFYNRESAQINAPAPSNLLHWGMSMSNVWKLLSSPAHYAQYPAQLVAMSGSRLAGRFGMGKAIGHLTDALGDSIALGKGSRRNPDISRVADADERAMLEHLQRNNVLDVTHEGDMADPNLFAGGMSGKAAAVVTYMQSLPRTIEAYNKIASALGAYRLAKAEALARNADDATAHATAMTYALKHTREAYGDYSTSNAPRIMMPGATPMGRTMQLVTQYKKFHVLHSALAIRDMYNAFNGADAETRAIARRSLGYMYGAYGAIGGAMGMPFAHTLGMVINKLFGDEGDDQETTFRKAIGDDNLADIILHGVPGMLGMDLTRKAGAGDIIEPVDFDRLSEAKGTGDYLATLAGPLAGELGDLAKNGLGQMASGNLLGGLINLMPKGIKDGGNAMYQAIHGTDSKGNPQMDPSDVDAIWRAAGIPTTFDTKQNSLKNSFYAAKADYQTKITSLQNEFRKSEDDDQARADVMSKWYDLQQEMRSRGLQAPAYSELTRPKQESKALQRFKQAAQQ